ncbi:MAG: alcohol dehydrogenase catalytic domain-containing protein [Desulfobacterales bacterium]|jgi:threonine dehydrogenase-like Zn-dependent dehydrogenase
MKAIVLNAPRDFCLQDIDDPAVSTDELEIRVNLVGICGTDQTMVRGTNPAIQYPIVPGHEFMGKCLKRPVVQDFNPAIGAILPLAGFAEGLQLLEEQPQQYFKVILSPLDKRFGLKE